MSKSSKILFLQSYATLMFLNMDQNNNNINNENNEIISDS